MITAGVNEETQIRKIFAGSPRPSHRIASGIQASGGIGRSSEKTGPIRASKRLLKPMSRPSGTPVEMATRKPRNTRRRLCPMCWNSVPPA
ncbi:hypothetical protein D9M68_943380 [compost metagenome]